MLPPLPFVAVDAELNPVSGAALARSILPPVPDAPVIVSVEVVPPVPTSDVTEPGTVVEKFAPATSVILPPFPLVELVSMTPAPGTVTMFCEATIARSCPEKLKLPAMVTSPEIL